MKNQLNRLESRVEDLIQKERDLRSQELFGKYECELQVGEKQLLEEYLNDLKNPVWKDAPGYEGLYQVSNVGLVKSVKRQGLDGRIIEERIMKTCPVGKGYLSVVLRKDGKSIREYVHRLVCLAFNKKTIPEYDVVNHKNGLKTCNWYKNLEWVSYHENNQHAYDNNLKAKGEKFYNAKLTESQVSEIKKIGKNGTFQSIADKYGVTKATIRDILVGKTWNTDKRV